MANTAGIVTNPDIRINPAFPAKCDPLPAEIVVLAFVRDLAVNLDEIEPEPGAHLSAFSDVRLCHRFHFFDDAGVDRHKARSHGIHLPDASSLSPLAHDLVSGKLSNCCGLFVPAVMPLCRGSSNNLLAVLQQFEE